MGLRLIIEDVEGATTIVPLSDDEVTIGRKGGNTIQLTEQNVSRNHARLRLIDGEWEIADLGSYNGVLVNGAPISAAMTLREGDLIQIGDYHLVLADELDKRTVDMDHPVRAANDDEPLLASSSADLPKLSQDELAALTSGTHRGRPAIDEDERDGGGGAGLKVVIGAVLAGVLVGGVWLAFGRGGQDAAPVAAQKQDAGAKTEKTEAAAEPTEPEPEPLAEAETGAPSAETGEAAPEPADAGEEPAATEGGEDEPASDDTSVGGEEPQGEPAAPGPKKKKKSTKKDGEVEESGGVPPPPSGPARTPQQLLADARKAQLAGDASTAYNLAKDAYQADKSQEALQLMGVSACKMGDASKARAAYKKLSGAKKEQLASVCAAKGIELE